MFVQRALRKSLDHDKKKKKKPLSIYVNNPLKNYRYHRVIRTSRKHVRDVLK